MIVEKKPTKTWKKNAVHKDGKRIIHIKCFKFTKELMRWREQNIGMCGKGNSPV